MPNAYSHFLADPFRLWSVCIRCSVRHRPPTNIPRITAVSWLWLVDLFFSCVPPPSRDGPIFAAFPTFYAAPFPLCFVSSLSQRCPWRKSSPVFAWRVPLSPQCPFSSECVVRLPLCYPLDSNTEGFPPPEHLSAWRTLWSCLLLCFLVCVFVFVSVAHTYSFSFGPLGLSRPCGQLCCSAAHTT